MGTAVGEVRENFEELARLAGAVFGPKGSAKVHEMAIESLLWQQEGLSTANRLQAQKTECLEREIAELRQKLDELVEADEKGTREMQDAFNRWCQDKT